MENIKSKFQRLPQRISERLKYRIKEHSLPKILFWILTGWIITSLIFTLKSKSEFTAVSFFGEINTVSFLTAAALISFMIFALLSDKAARLLMLFSALAYAVTTSAKCGSFTFSLGVCAASALIIFYTNTSDLKPKIKKRTMWIISGLLTAAFTLFVSFFCCLYYRNYWTSCFDFGLFSQMFHYMKETGLPLITCERDGLLNHFAVHFSPVYYLLLPVYAIAPSPVTLLIMQALITASGAIPLVLICKNHKLSNLASAAFVACYILYPCMAGGCFSYIHENNFLAPLILWFLYFAERNRNILKIIFAVLILLVKEDAAVYTAVMAIYLISLKKSPKTDSAILAVSIIYFITVTKILANIGDGVMTWRYSNYMYDGRNDLYTVISSCIKNPAYVIQQCFSEEKLIFILQCFVPLAFLPLITKKAKRLILFIPFVLVNLMTNYTYQFDIGYQYCFGSCSLLIYLAAVNYSDLKNVGKLLLTSLFSSVIIFGGLYYSRTDYLEFYKDSAANRKAIDQALTYIPENASVISSTFILPNLSQRDEIYELEYTDKTAEYYVIDLRFETDKYDIDDYSDEEEFEKIYYKENIIAVFKNKNY